jgi:hypothetical protein
MKLTESKLRSLVREELKSVLEMHGRQHMPVGKDARGATAGEVAAGVGAAGMAIAPAAIAAYLRTNPDMMKKVIDFIEMSGGVIQNLNPFEEE